jgi:hypothetical protein
LDEGGIDFARTRAMAVGLNHRILGGVHVFDCLANFVDQGIAFALQGGEVAIDFLHVDRQDERSPQEIDRAIKSLDPREI